MGPPLMRTATTPAALAIAARYLLHPLTGYAIEPGPGGAPYLECATDPAGRNGYIVNGGVTLRARRGSGAVYRWTRIRFTGGGPDGPRLWTGREVGELIASRRALPAPVDPAELPLATVASRLTELEHAPRGITLSGQGLAALAALAPVEAGRYRFDALNTTRGGVYTTDGRAAIRVQGTYSPGPDGEAPTFLVAGDVIRAAVAAVKRYRAGHRAHLVCDPWGAANGWGTAGVELYAGGVSALFGGSMPEGDFPPVDTVIPAASDCPRSADPATAGTVGELAAAGRVFRRAGSGHRPVVAVTPGGAARITGTPEQYPGAPLCLDPTYVALALRAVGAPARILWSDPARPCRVEGPDGVAVIMPVAVER